MPGATWTQGFEDWISAHERCFAYLGGVPEVVVPDNLRAGVAEAHRYEPDINLTYQDLATHYGVAIIPARAHHPRDKAKAKIEVQVVERWILAALRHRQCFCLAELNRAIRALLETLNHRPFKKVPGTRRAPFEQLDKPALRPCPSNRTNTPSGSRPGSILTITSRSMAITTPCPMRSSTNKGRRAITANTIECFHRGQRVASHRRSSHKGRHTTVAAHMPEAHRQAGEWSPQRLGRWTG